MSDDKFVTVTVTRRVKKSVLRAKLSRLETRRQGILHERAELAKELEAIETDLVELQSILGAEPK